MKDFVRACRFFFGYAFVFSFFINILQLTFSIYMLQVYDKVLTSYNLSTLAVITIAAVFALVVLAALEWIRSRLLVRAGIEFDMVLSRTVLEENLKSASNPIQRKGEGTLRDIHTLRNFLGGSAVFAFFDAPWMPIYFGIIFMLHPYLGMVSIFGGVSILILGLLTERLTKRKLESATALNGHASAFMTATLRNSIAVRSMGMISNIADRWEKINSIVIDLQTRASRNAGLLHAISKSLRVLLQVMIYCVGAYLTVMHASTAGVMIAASIVMGRALAPIDQAMATYKQSLDSYAAYKRLSALLDNSTRHRAMDLPAPSGSINCEDVTFGINGRVILKGISFALPAGESLAIIGPSAAGKSTLCKILLGVWPPSTGKVRLDGADMTAWDQEVLGKYIGYLPQDVELFAGTIADNIARMGNVVSENVIAAATLAGVHDLILRLPKGYDTQIGEQGAVLSGGQRQRIGLARALYGNPKIVILDEPNSNLDDAGEAALLKALVDLKQQGTTVLLVTHKPHVLSIVDRILLVQEGQLALFGPRQAVFDHLANAQQKG